MSSKGFRTSTGSNALGRAVGYRVDPELLFEGLGEAQISNLTQLGSSPKFVEGIGKTMAGQGARAGRQAPKRFWVVVKVEAGIPVMVDAYLDKRSAAKREQFLRQHMRPETDEVGLFAVPNPLRSISRETIKEKRE